MTLEEYMGAIEKFDLYPKLPIGTMGVVFGLVSEAGELAGKLSKDIRGDGVSNEAIKAEVGDVLWYVVTLCRRMGWTVESLMEENINKLSDRQDRNVLRGNGDNR